MEITKTLTTFASNILHCAKKTPTEPTRAVVSLSALYNQVRNNVLLLGGPCYNIFKPILIALENYMENCDDEHRLALVKECEHLIKELSVD